jgi:hypothetical protein
MRSHVVAGTFVCTALSTTACTRPVLPPADEAAQVQAAALRTLWDEGEFRGSRFCLRQSLPYDSVAPGTPRQEDPSPGLLGLLAGRRPPVVAASTCGGDAWTREKGSSNALFTVSVPRPRAGGGYEVTLAHTCGPRCGTGHRCDVDRQRSGWRATCEVRAIF